MTSDQLHYFKVLAGACSGDAMPLLRKHFSTK
jgi:hypothetical protein